MSSFSFPTIRPVQVTRSIAVAALLGATMLAGPLIVARAAPATCERRSGSVDIC